MRMDSPDGGDMYFDGEVSEPVASGRGGANRRSRAAGSLELDGKSDAPLPVPSRFVSGSAPAWLRVLFLAALLAGLLVLSEHAFAPSRPLTAREMSRRAATEAVLKCRLGARLSERRFKRLWPVLRAYVAHLSARERARLVGIDEVTAIRLRFLRDPEGACDDLVHALRKCKRYIVSGGEYR